MNRKYHEKKMAEYAAAKALEFDGVRDAMAITFVTLSESGAIDEVTAAEHTALFAMWEPGIAYVAGNVRRYGEDEENNENSKLYKCLQGHTSQIGWEPDKAPSLWKKIGDPTVEFPEWSQPVGAGDAYMTGDKVSHDGKHWVSVADNNVWEPGVYGWEIVPG